ncbi:LOW QUALITY PROTEIN: MORC family CW-type zinc finger protein 4 [Spheniscus humboldti]
MTHHKLYCMLKNKDGKLELDFDTDHDIWIADFLADDGEILSRKVLYSQNMVPEFPGPSRMALPQLCSVHDSQGMKGIKSKLDFGFTWKRLHVTRILLPLLLCCPLSQAYCNILYLKPCMQIVLDKKVNTQLITKSLANIEYDFYKPRFISKRVKITFGFTCKNKSHYGIMMYHNNQLIRSYEKVGCQRKGGGVGVIGVIECNFLNRAHNKEDSEEGKECCLLHQCPGLLGPSSFACTVKLETEEKDDCSPERRWTSGENQTLNSKKSFAVPYQEREKLVHIKQEDMNVGGSLHTCLLKEKLGTLSSTSPANSVSRCLKAETEALPSSSTGDQEETGVVQGKLEKQMPNLIAKRQASDFSVCVNSYRSTKDTDKGFFVAVGVLKTAASGEAPICLFPFGWKARLDRSKVEKAPCLSGGDRGGGELQVLNTQEQEDIMEWENVRRLVENIFVELRTISAEWDLLRCKCQAVWQKWKAKLARSAEEKAELTERLKNREMQLGVLREAQVSRRGSEKEDVKSVMEKLKNLLMNVSWLLSFILPHLELHDINFELDQVDEILQTILEETNLMLE